MDQIHVGLFCKLNKNTRIRFSSIYCSDLSFVEILEGTGVMTIPYIVYVSVLIHIVCLVMNMTLKLNFRNYKRSILLFESLSFIFAASSILMYLDTINSQNVFDESNSIPLHTGFKFQVASFLVCFCTLVLGLVKLKRKDDNVLIWVD
jgi:hypothetical protein